MENFGYLTEILQNLNCLVLESFVLFSPLSVFTLTSITATVIVGISKRLDYLFSPAPRS